MATKKILNIPSRVNIFGKKYKVKNSNILKDHGIEGLCDGEKSTILISTHSQEPIQTLLHEIGHAVFERTGLCQAINPELEEIVVENIARAIADNFQVKPL